MDVLLYINHNSEKKVSKIKWMHRSTNGLIEKCSYYVFTIKHLLLDTIINCLISVTQICYILHELPIEVSNSSISNYLI